MKAQILVTSNLRLPSPNLESRTRNSLPSAAFPSRNTSVRFPPLQNPNFKVVEAVRFDCPVMDVTELEDEDCKLVIETCITRTFPPALTLEHGIESVKKAVEDLKLNPPSATHGVFRFQVVVPPSPKALNWFCSQPELNGVFPRFFLSNDNEDVSCRSLYLNRTRGVFGIGAAICFASSSSCTPEKQSRIRRYLSSNSDHMRCYGVVDANFNIESSSIEHEAGSFYFLVPEIELDEHEEASILAVTLAWDENFGSTFEQAIQSFESSICQASSYFWTNTKCIKSAFRTFNLLESKTFQMACANALLLDRRNHQADTLEMRGTSFSTQYCFRLAPLLGISSNMLDDASENSLQDRANINAVWASLIVEECSRLGITYFCIAPGSRSSPLAIAAATHPLTTCISCFDERSLAFHAVGYARGSHKPAVIITSSGTAVSNLHPAVVEASQDFVPLLLLTADRPPELQDTGANQAINQVNHFGSFVRFFFSLPAPADNIPARMVLTTIDSAVHWATSLPYGPVHINCPFREPLDGSPDYWMLSCLKGLDIWMSGAEPFTKYVPLQNSIAWKNGVCVPMTEILEIIKGAERGLLLLGAIHTEDDIWAALLLAKHLNWPVVADILSGLRLRKLMPSLAEIEESVLFVDHLDHALLSEWVRSWIHFDAVIQIGSRITSKRIYQMLEKCFPCSYVLVDNHPCRHDPSHFVTHRVQCSIIQFADSLMKSQFSHKRRKSYWYLQALNMMVAWDMSFQINVENSLTEPHVAHVIAEALSLESALFVGNSMVIRDADMYGHNWKAHSGSIANMMLDSELPCLGIRVAGNRGASGIDGLFSTAIGFAVGCNKQVLCLIGDVSLLHDTNGLAILTQRLARKPMMILVINNHGGAIFSLLPIADRTDPRILNHYFYTSHSISIDKLCMAHGVKHVQVKTKAELQDALVKFEHGKTDCVIEVESCIDANSSFHSILRKSASQAADHALNILLRLSVPESGSDGLFLHKIDKLEYSLYRIQLCAPPTSSCSDHHLNEFHREGYILSVSLEDGSVGYGEVAPLEIHKENLLDVEEQLQYILHVIKGARIDISLPMLKGSFTSWMWNRLGIMESSIFPSVRCGLEMAILNAVAVGQGSGLLGFTALKLKVARRSDPAEDAAVVCKVREDIDLHVEIRVDANRKWTFDEAIQFGFLVKDCDLQYIEEPVQHEEDIIKFCEETGLPVALDETLDNFRGSHLNMLAKYTHPKIVALVIKPSVIGGFEKAASIALWAQKHGKMAVISAAFESGLGLSAYILFSYYLEQQNAEVCTVMNREIGPSIAHGLGTYRWLKQDVTDIPLGIHYDPCSGYVGAPIVAANQLLQKFQVNHNVILKTSTEEPVHRYHLTANSKNFSSSIKVYEAGEKNDIGSPS